MINNPPIWMHGLADDPTTRGHTPACQVFWRVAVGKQIVTPIQKNPDMAYHRLFTGNQATTKEQDLFICLF